MGVRAVLIAVFSVMMLLACRLMIPGASGDEATGEMVPEPELVEWHYFNEDRYGMRVNEEWALDINNGGTLIKLAARNASQDQGYGTDYQFNIHYDIDGTLYIAQLYMIYMGIIIDGQGMEMPLRTSNDLELSHTPIVYVGTTPTLWCNITFYNIRVYPNQHPESTLDLTLCHHVTADWNQTTVKVEAVIDISDLLLFQNLEQGWEFEMGKQFSLEVRYRMGVGKANSDEAPLSPSSYSNTGLEYNLTTSTGDPLTISTMNMQNHFTVTNGTGPYASTAYSDLLFDNGPLAIHGFPGLIYKDTLSVKSDPEITVYHDRETNDGLSGMLMPLIIGAMLVAATVVLVVFAAKKKEWI